MTRDQISVDARKAWADAGYMGTIEGATGIGKTKIAIDAICDQLLTFPNADVLLVVPTEVLRDTGWPDEFRKWDCEYLVNRVERVCYASLHKIDKYFNLVVLDEAHHITPNNSIYFEKHTTCEVLGLTATYPDPEWDTEKYDLLSKICPPVYKITLDEAVNLDLVADFDVKVLKFYIDAVTKNVPSGTVKKPFMSTEKGHYQYLTKRLSYFSMLAAKNPKNKGAVFPWIQKRMTLLYNLPSKMRLAKVSLAAMQKDGKRTLVFCGSIEQSIELCGENVYNSKTTDEMLIKFQNKEIDTLGVVRSLNEGANIVDLDQILIVNGSSKERDAVQRIGRTIRKRPGHKALVAVLVALSTADENWYKSAFENFDKKRITEYIVRVPDVKKSELETAQ